MSVAQSTKVLVGLFASVILVPGMKMGLLFIPIPIPSYIFAPLYLALEAYLAKRGGTGVAHDAHLWGALFGLLFVALIEPSAYVKFFEYVVWSLS